MVCQFSILQQCHLIIVMWRKNDYYIQSHNYYWWIKYWRFHPIIANHQSLLLANISSYTVCQLSSLLVMYFLHLTVHCAVALFTPSCCCMDNWQHVFLPHKIFSRTLFKLTKQIFKHCNQASQSVTAWLAIIMYINRENKEAQEKAEQGIME